MDDYNHYMLTLAALESPSRGESYDLRRIPPTNNIMFSQKNHV